MSAKILFVDDEPAILSSLRSLFRRDGYKISCFSSGAEALTFLERNNVDIVLTDLLMPDMNGIEFLRRARVHCPHAVCIMVSGLENKQDVLLALANGLAHHYIMKPWDDNGIRSLLHEALAHQQSLQKHHLSEVVSSFPPLPVPAKFCNRLLSLLAKENASQNELVDEIEKHPAFVAKLLRISNSVYFATRNPVSTVRDAILFIGTDYVSSLVFAFEAFDGLTKEMDPVNSNLLDDLWLISVRRASIAKSIAEKWPGFKDAKQAYVAGLFQDIGHVLRLCVQPDAYGEYLRMMQEQNIPFYEADIKVFTVPHDAVGAALLEHWNFPKPIVTAVARHHGLAGDDVLSQILQIAQVLDTEDSSMPHDPMIDPLIEAWRTTLKNSLQKTLSDKKG